MSSAIKAKPPPRVNPSPQKIHIAYSARLVRFVYLSQLRLGIIPNVTFCVYSAGDRSGPGILRLQFQRIVFTLLNFPEGTLFNKVYCYPALYASNVLSLLCLCSGLSQGCRSMISLKPAIASNGVVCPD